MKKSLAIVGLATAMSVSTAFAQPVDVIDVNQSIPVLLTVPNPCTIEEPGTLPDIVVLTGNLHITGDLTVSQGKNMVVGKLHYNAQGISGEGFAVLPDGLGGTILEPTGVHYQGVGTGNINFKSSGLPTTERARVKFAMISGGPTDNFFVTVDFDLTIDAAGNVTATPVLSSLEVECRG
jgi:hypothetical protein